MSYINIAGGMMPVQVDTAVQVGNPTVPINTQEEKELLLSRTAVYICDSNPLQSHEPHALKFKNMEILSPEISPKKRRTD